MRVKWKCHFEPNQCSKLSNGIGSKNEAPGGNAINHSALSGDGLPKTVLKFLQP